MKFGREAESKSELFLSQPNFRGACFRRGSAFCFIKKRAAPWRGKLMGEGLGRAEADLMVAGHEIGHCAWAQAGLGQGAEGVWSAWPELANLRMALMGGEALDRAAERAGAGAGLCLALAAAFVEEARAALASDNPEESFGLMCKLRARDGEESAGRYSCHGAWSRAAFEAFAAGPSPQALRELAGACMRQACACAAGWLAAPCEDAPAEAIRLALLSMGRRRPGDESLDAAEKRLESACEASGPDVRWPIPFSEESCRIFAAELGKAKRSAAPGLRLG